MRFEDQEFIPDWVSTTLGNRICFEYGKSPNNVRDEKGKYLLVGSSGITGKASKYLSSSPTIILGRKGTIDKPIYLETPCWAIDTTYFVDKFPNDESKYFFYLLSFSLNSERSKGPIRLLKGVGTDKGCSGRCSAWVHGSADALSSDCFRA